MKLRDKWGWPVVRIKGKHTTNVIRYLLHTNLFKTWQYRNGGGRETVVQNDSSLMQFNGTGTKEQ